MQSVLVVHVEEAAFAFCGVNRETPFLRGGERLSGRYTQLLLDQERRAR